MIACVRSQTPLSLSLPARSRLYCGRALKPILTAASWVVLLERRGPGPGDGANIAAFHAAYVHFEKLRIRDGETKKNEREEVKEAWRGEGGMERERSHNKWIALLPGEKTKIDSFGRLQIADAGI